MTELTQQKHYEMAHSIFGVIQEKYYENAELYLSFEGQDQAVIVAHWFRVDELAGKKKAEAITDALGKFQIRTAFEDEVAECDMCGTAVEIQPTHYGWQPNWIYDKEEMEYICRHCVEQADADELEDYIESFKCELRAVPDWMAKDLQRIGFVCMEDDALACARFESGWHPHQTDDPNKVAKEIEEKLPHHDYVFKLNSVGQFDVNYSVFIRNRQ